MTRITSSSMLVAGAIVALIGPLAREAPGQVAVITGQVTGRDSASLGGAIVTISEFNVGATTAIGGTYTLTIAAERVRGQVVTLSARYIGYASLARTITLTPGSQVQDFALKWDPLTLDEIVVTGTAEATSTKKLTFSVGRVSEAQLQEVPALNPIQSLSGKVAGAHVTSPSGAPGAVSAVRLRGATSLTPGASQQPLLVVDGILTYGTMADLNVEDIESIEVVKGAAASSLYGSNAASGVIQVFTRRGKNVAEGLTNVTVRNEFGLSGLSRRLPINQSHYFQLDGSGNYVDGDPAAAGVQKVLEADHIADNPYPASTPFRDQQDAILGSGQFFTNYMSVARHQGGTNFMVSFENQKNFGIVDVPGINLDGYGRKSVRMNVDQIVSDQIDVSAGGYFSNSNAQDAGVGGQGSSTVGGVGSTFFSVLFMPPDVDLFLPNADGTPFKVDVGLDGAITSSDRNPLYSLANLDARRNRTRIEGSFRGRWRPSSWLLFEGSFAYDRQTQTFRSYTPKGTLSAAGQPGGGSLNITDLGRETWNTGVSATLDRTFGDLQARVKGSYVFENDETNTNFAGGTDFASASTPDLDNLSNQGTKQISSFQSLIRAGNVFGVVGFEYKGRYIADALVRRDGSSLFGPDARYRTYYRVSGAWRVSEDLKIPGVEELRLRASRGTAGLRPPFEAQYETFTTGGGQISPAVLGNRNLRPAHSTETEVGFNVDFLNRFTLEYSYSDRLTIDQVLQVPLSSVAGFTSQWRNAGALKGQTHELALGAVLVNSRDFSWRLNVTGDRTRQRVTSLSTLAFPTGSGQQSNDLFLIREGEIYGSMWGYRFAHTPQELLDNPANVGLDISLYSVNEDGFVILTSTKGTLAERAIKYVDRNGSTYYQIGDANPDFSTAFTNTLTFKGFTVYGLLDWVQGGDIYNLPRQWLSRAEFRAAEIDQAGRPASARKSSDYYSAINDANNFNEFYVENGTYARLRELSVSYAFTSRTLERIGLSRLFRSLRVGVIGRNLITWTGYSGLDPEAYNPVDSNSGDPTTFRFDSFSYPNFRTFSAMIEIGF